MVDGDFPVQPAFVLLPHIDKVRLQRLHEALTSELALRSLVRVLAPWRLQSVEQTKMYVLHAMLMVQ